MSGKVPEINLVFDEPVQRKKAPKHLADFSPADRKAFAKELGFQPFRAAQVATHYFQHLSNNPDEWTDIPAAERQAIADALGPGFGKARYLAQVRRYALGQGGRHIVGVHLGQLLPHGVAHQGMHRIQNAPVLGQLQNFAKLLDVHAVGGVRR